MENRINQIITTESGNKYMILHQAIYEGQNFFVCCGVEANDDFKDCSSTKTDESCTYG